MAKPSQYNEKIGNQICLEIATTTNGIHKIAKKRHIGFSTIMKWLRNFPSFAQQYALAKEMQADLVSSQILEIADNIRIGIKIVNRGGKKEITTYDVVERSRLMVNARKWLAARLAPQKYGYKLDLTSDGERLSPEIIQWTHTEDNTEFTIQSAARLSQNTD